MKESPNLTIALLSHIGHSLKNIETVLKEAVEELLSSEDAQLSTIGKDAEIALGKLSNISNTIGILEEGAEDTSDNNLIALKNILSYSPLGHEINGVKLEIKKANGPIAQLNLPWNEVELKAILCEENPNAEIPRINHMLIKILYKSIKDEGFTFWIKGKQIF